MANEKSNMPVLADANQSTDLLHNDWARELDSCRCVRMWIVIGGCVLMAFALVLPVVFLFAQYRILSMQEQILAIQSAIQQGSAQSTTQIAATQDVVAQLGTMVSITPQFAAVVIVMLLVAAFLLSFGARLSRALISECNKRARLAE